jgi:hypothetical protein
MVDSMGTRSEPERASGWVITIGDELDGAVNCSPVANKDRRDYCDAKRVGKEAILFVRECGFGDSGRRWGSLEGESHRVLPLDLEALMNEVTQPLPLDLSS